MVLMTKNIPELYSAIEDIIPLLETQKEKFQVTEVLSENRYEFFAVPHSLTGIGGSLFRGAERIFKGDVGKARDTYDIPGPQVASRLQEVHRNLKQGTIALRNFQSKFDPKTIQVEDLKFKIKEKISFIVNFIPQPA